MGDCLLEVHRKCNKIKRTTKYDKRRHKLDQCFEKKFLEIYLYCFNFQLLNCSLAHMKTKPSILSQTERKLTNIIS